MSPDLNEFFQKVFEKAISQSPILANILIQDDRDKSENFLIEVLGEKLASLFVEDNQEEREESEVIHQSLSEDILLNYHFLLEKNEMLAAALGACHCWGEQEGCPDCGGEGLAGWKAPDIQLYRYLVLPANRTLRQFKLNQNVSILHH
ncbi:MAG: hypothetical protein AAFR87_34635 [Bacteroidota bacterium]